MSASRRRRRMEIRLQDGRIKAESVRTVGGSGGEAVFGFTKVDAEGNPLDGFRFKVTKWSGETRHPIDQQAN